MNILQKIFSVKNDLTSSHKVLTIFGIKFKFKSKILLLQKNNQILQENLNHLILKNEELKYKLNKFSKVENYPVLLKEWYFNCTGENLDLDNPKTYNEKLQWMKLYDDNSLKTILSDKYLVRNWIKEKVGEEYLIPLLGVYNNFDEINFKELPNQFVIKCNHGSGYNIIVKENSLIKSG